MSFLLSLLLDRPPYLVFPQSNLGRIAAGLGWLLFLAFILILHWRWRRYNAPLARRNPLLLAGLIAATVIGSLALGVRLPGAGGLTRPGLPVEQGGPALMVFAAIPWMLAGGILGPAAAAALAALSGVLLALWETSNPFTPLELALMATLLAVSARQGYRTLLFRLLRRPLLAAALVALVYPLIYLTSVIFGVDGSLAVRLDYGLSHVLASSLAMAGGLLVAGTFAQVVAITLPGLWGAHSPWLPSPPERSLQARFMYWLAPLAAVLVLTLIAGDWFLAGSAARSMLNSRMANAASLAVQTVPYFLEAGQNLLRQVAQNPVLLSTSNSELQEFLNLETRRVPYFSQLIVLDANYNLRSAYPPLNYSYPAAPREERAGIDLALKSGVPFQLYTIKPESNQETAQVSFIVSIPGDGQKVQGVLIGRTDLASNPFTRPLMSGLKSLEDLGGQGILLDENNRILVHPQKTLLMETYTLRGEGEVYYDDTAPDGTRLMVYSQSAQGRPWTVVFTVPAQRAQQLALDIAAPMLLMIVLLAVCTVILMRLGLRVITASLQTLATEAGLIARGQLDHPLAASGEDEAGQLGRAFEQMRLSLKARLDELNRLLLVSQGVASSLEISEAVPPVLEAALRMGACSARIVLNPAVLPFLESGGRAQSAFALGPAGELYSDLDEQILALTQQQDRLVITNPNRPRLLKLTPGGPRPEALLAIALRHENLYYGSLWIVYDQPHVFSEEEVRFLVTLAGQAALAAANSRLYSNAEVGRQRLAAILASTPDPVLVTDQQNRLLLANPAAWRVLGLGIEWDEGQPIENILGQMELLSLMRSSEEKGPVEVRLPDGRIYSATASTVLSEGQRMGRVCVLRDISYLKELDSLKSEFVATVSHDLRSPLTLMRGYATMLEMVGELNEQQVGYVRKIVGSVESMNRLVTNLLDLGRIEAGVDLQLEMVNVQDVIDRVIGALQMQANQKRVQLSVEIPAEGLPLLEADQALLQQSLQNLVENAIKYTEANGKAIVKVVPASERLVFSVSDTGIGIAPVDQPHLFEKFYRGAQSGNAPQRGTGLGLAIVKSIAERHGGQVWVESQLGKGSTFYLAFPLRQPSGSRPAVSKDAVSRA